MRAAFLGAVLCVGVLLFSAGPGVAFHPTNPETRDHEPVSVTFQAESEPCHLGAIGLDPVPHSTCRTSLEGEVTFDCTDREVFPEHDQSHFWTECTISTTGSGTGQGAEGIAALERYDWLSLHATWTDQPWDEVNSEPAGRSTVSPTLCIDGTASPRALACTFQGSWTWQHGGAECRTFTVDATVTTDHGPPGVLEHKAVGTAELEVCTTDDGVTVEPL